MGSQIQLDRIELFVSVIQKGSFTKAALEHDISKSMVSQHISKLEENLGIKLLNRTTRQLKLTQAGEIYYQSCVKVIAEAQSALVHMQHLQEEPAGMLRITAQQEFGTDVIIPLLCRFRRQYPNIKLDILLTEEKLDLLEHNIDVAIRIGQLEDSTMIGKTIGEAKHLLCASPDYLKNNPAPQHPTELTDHPWLHHSIFPEPRQFTLTNQAGIEFPCSLTSDIKVNTAQGVLTFIRQGMGIGLSLNHFVSDDIKQGSIIKLLPDYQFKPIPIYAIFPSKKHMPKKVRLFLDYLSESLKASD